MKLTQKPDLTGKVAVVTGGAGVLEAVSAKHWLLAMLL